MNHHEFNYVRAELRALTGVVLEDNKQYLVTTRLRPVARRFGLPSVSALIQRLRQGAEPALTGAVVEALTTHFTSFFRDRHPFDALQTAVIPDLICARQRSRRLTVWCAAASSGEEPFSVAMLLHHHFQSVLHGWYVRVIATDVCQKTLDRASEARFAEEDIQKSLPQEYRRYFRRAEEGLRLCDTIRGMVEFRQLNLTGAWGSLPGADLILMRNVLIYFDEHTKGGILDRAARKLNPGGYLLLGSTETTLNLSDAFRCVSVQRSSFYQVNTETGIQKLRRAS
jgi:chemotaxis protein methyltransferase CheR